MDLLERARHVVSRREPRAALVVLLEVWRKVPDPQLALPIAELTRHVANRRPTNELPRWTNTEWDVAEARRDPVEYDALLSNVTRHWAAIAGDRLRRLLEWPRDPRLGEYLARWLDAAPYSSTIDFWDVVVDAIEVSNDPRVLTAIDRGAPHGIGTRWVRDRVIGRLRVARERLRSKLPAIIELDTGDRATCDALLAEIATWDATLRSREQMEAMFLERIRADPADDGARLVLADWLQLEGDPRGEMIALGFARRDGRATAEGKKLEAQLLRKHAASWLGSLAKAIGRRTMGFERGFIASLSIAEDTKLRNTVGDAAWATVERVEVTQPMTYPQTLANVLGHPVMRALRSVGGITLDVLERLVASPIAAQLERLALTATSGDRDAMLGRLESGALPRLRSLEWTDAPTATRLGQLVALPLPIDAVTLRGVSTRVMLKLERADGDRWHLTTTRPPAVGPSQLDPVIAPHRHRFATITNEAPERHLEFADN